MLPGASRYTNPLSILGYYFPELSPRISMRILGTRRVLGVIGRTMPFVSAPLLGYDAISIVKCTYEYAEKND